MGGACETRAISAASADALSTVAPEDASRLALGVIGCG